MEIKDKIEGLVRDLNVYSDAYYNRVPIIEDSEFDKLYDELLRLEEETGYILSNSPTRNVGFEVVSDLKKVKHKKKLLSLRKTKSISDIMAKIGSEECISSLKLDGLTTEIEYKNGELFRASTRGDGMVGEDITHSVKVYKNIPLKLSKKIDITVVGESIIKQGDFKHLNSKLPKEEQFKNPRNAVSGTVRNLNSQVTKNRNVRFIAFDIASVNSMYKQETYLDTLNFLNDLGFNIVPNISGSSLVYFEQLKEYAKLTGFEIDGVVVRINNNNKYKDMGQNEKYPLGSIAFKFFDESEETSILDIEWTMGRTGVLTPVAVFNEVELDGTCVSRASLHNISHIEKINLGGFGSIVKVAKSNKIIPQITEVVEKIGGVDIPTKCPFCKENTEVSKDKLSKILRCSNGDCCERLVMNLSHYVSRNCMNIIGLSEQLLRTFVKHDLLSSAIDIYNLHKNKEYISSIEGFGEKSTKAIIENIEASKNITLARFINSLGIPNIGLTTSKEIASQVETIDNFFSMSKSQWCELLGDAKGNSISEYISKNMLYIRILVSNLNIEEEEKAQTSKLENKNFCLTGSCKHFANRNELKKYIEDNGGSVKSSVTSNTHYLVCNQEEDSTKYRKAVSLKIEIITELELLEMCK